MLAISTSQRRMNNEELEDILEFCLITYFSSSFSFFIPAHISEGPLDSGAVEEEEKLIVFFFCRVF